LIRENKKTSNIVSGTKTFIGRGRAMKPEIIAAALSAVLPGVGQLYNHHWVKGVGFLAVVMIISAFMRRGMLLAGSMSGIAWLLLLLLFGLVIVSVADAYRSAKRVA
jgi:TM2 domain-containing membrane protein YozV